MNELIAAVQLFFSIIIGIYFFVKLKNERNNDIISSSDNKTEAERVNKMRHISLSEPLTEKVRPNTLEGIIGQSDGIRALKAALCGKNPQHIIIYGPPGVGKTAAARLALEEAKKSLGTPFLKNAKFIEADATIMRYDERSIADPLIGSVHDPIYQGAGAYGEAGVPQPKEGAVSKAHGGILFIDEIGELPNEQMNRLLKVLEDRRVFFESAYYSSGCKKIPAYIHDIFQNGLPADFRLIGATTRKPEELPEAIRSRCVEVFFSELTRSDMLVILNNAVQRLDIGVSEEAVEYIADYAKNGRDGVKLIQMLENAVLLENRGYADINDAEWVVATSHYCKPESKIIDISLIKKH